MPIWILVADANRARVFKAVKKNGPLEEVEDFVHPASRLHEGDLVTDSGGSNRGPNGRHGVDNGDVHKREEAEQFARELAAELDRALRAGSFSRIYLVAPPRFLGLLRQSISPQLGEKVSGEIDKDLTQHTPQKIRELLPQYL